MLGGTYQIVYRACADGVYDVDCELEEEDCEEEGGHGCWFVWRCLRDFEGFAVALCSHVGLLRFLEFWVVVEVEMDDIGLGTVSFWEYFLKLP